MPRKAFLVLAMAVGIAAGSYWYFWAAPTTTSQPQRAPAPTIPVKATVVQRQDVPIFLSGIGTVHAFNIVTVKTRVDGHLDRVAFVEGQDVSEAGRPRCPRETMDTRITLAQATADSDALSTRREPLGGAMTPGRRPSATVSGVGLISVLRSATHPRDRLSQRAPGESRLPIRRPTVQALRDARFVNESTPAKS